MMKLRTIGLIAVMCLFAATMVILWTEGGSVQNKTRETLSRNERKSEITAKRDLLSLMMAYTGEIQGVEKGKDSLVYLIMRSGDRIVYDDQKAKSFEQKLANADVQDMMEQLYPLDDIEIIQKGDSDPGRIRCYPFFKAVYGKTKGETQDNLVNVTLASGCTSFNKKNGAAGALEAVFQRISGLIRSKPEIYGFVYPVAGTFNYRVIAGTNQLSPHAFGIAIDLKSDSKDYWRWANREQGQKRIDSYPREIVRAFEDGYFIWGGKWAHFDILHYEYRPELIIKARYLSEPEILEDTWHQGYPDTEATRAYIGIIDRAFE